MIMNNYISGRLVGVSDSVRPVLDIKGAEAFQVAASTYWDIEAAVETAATVQPKLAKIPVEVIAEALKNAMEYFFQDQEKYNVLVDVTGGAKQFVVESIEMTKQWVESSLEFYHAALSGNGCDFMPSTPTFAILPSNSEQEFLYIIAQTLLARSATILRPSSKGAGAFTALEFVHAWRKAVSSAPEEHQKNLLAAFSVVNTQSRDYLEQFCVNDWNYIIFGDDGAVSSITAFIRERCSPRAVVDYGTGLSSSIVFPDCEMGKTVHDILDSVIVNSGNDCISTDIIYAHSDCVKQLLAALRERAKNFLSKNPYDETSIGFIKDDNLHFIVNELYSKGRNNELSIETLQDERIVEPLFLEINEYETAIEYPGPIASVRAFRNVDELIRLINQDLKRNKKRKSLATSIFGSEGSYRKITPHVKCYTLRHNRPTHAMNLMKPHQGKYLLKELVDPFYIE